MVDPYSVSRKSKTWTVGSGELWLGAKNLRWEELCFDKSGCRGRPGKLTKYYNIIMQYYIRASRVHGILAGSLARRTSVVERIPGIPWIQLARKG